MAMTPRNGSCCCTATERALLPEQALLEPGIDRVVPDKDTGLASDSKWSIWVPHGALRHANAPYARPDLKSLLKGLQLVMSKNYPIRGLA